MDRVVYTTMTGAVASEQRLNVLSNNLANASTNGFRAQLSAFQAAPVRGEGNPTRVSVSETTIGYSDISGQAQYTGRTLDVMAQNKAWFAVQGLDGIEGYTRNGGFELSSTGELTTRSGLSVLSDSGTPIVVPASAELTIGTDGTMTAKVGEQPAVALGRLKMITPGADDGLLRGEDGLFRSRLGDPLPSDATARLRSGSVEGSNVNPVEAMVEMIQVGRQFEVHMRLLQSAEANDRSAAQLLSLQG